MMVAHSTQAALSAAGGLVVVADTVTPGTSTSIYHLQSQSPADLLATNNHGHKQELQVRILDTRTRNELL